jgi:16S rRNA C967 or C1407 C5-methylase (RsmB/RsmF family)
LFVSFFWQVLQGFVGEAFQVDEGVFDKLEDPVTRLAAKRSLPHWLARELVQTYGAEGADALATQLNKRPVPTLR